MTAGELIKELEVLLPDLLHGQETHRQWRDYLQENPSAFERNPECGGVDFHQRMVEVYENRIETVRKTMVVLSKMDEIESTVFNLLSALEACEDYFSGCRVDGHDDENLAATAAAEKARKAIAEYKQTGGT